MAAKRGVKMPRALPHAIGAMGKPKASGKGKKAARGTHAVAGTMAAKGPGGKK